MPKDTIYTPTIHYNNGDVQKYAFLQQHDDANLTRNIESFKDSRQIIIMLENKMVWIPMQSVQRLDLRPAPRAWSQHTITIHDAKLIG